jgi:hypothetical protein
MSGVLSWLARPEAWIAGLAVIACVGLYALLRGAIREGEQTEGPGPRAGYRDAMVAATVACQALVGLAAVVAVNVGIPWSLPPFALGLGGLAAVVRANRRHRHESPTLRRVVQIADAALTGSLLAGVLVVGNVLAFRYFDRPLDLTRDRAFSLSSLSVRQLRELKRPVTFTIFHGNSPRAVRQRARVAQLLDLYRAVNPRNVRVVEVAQYADPVQFEDLVKRMPDVGVTPGGVLVELGVGDSARRTVARFGDLFEAAPGAGPEQFAASFKGEDVLTSTLIRLREEKPLKLAFTTGHGEPSVLDMQEPAGLGLFRSRLVSYGAEAGTISLVRDPIPSDLDVLFVVRAQTPFDPRESERLQGFVAKGGRVVLLLDARKRTGLEDWLKTFRIDVGSGIIADPRFNVGRADLPIAPVIGTGLHPIVAPLANRTILIPGAVPLALATAATPGMPPPDPRWSVQPVLRTSPDARLVRTGTEPETPAPARPTAVAPFTIGMAVTEIETTAAKGKVETPRIVVFSSPFLADNQVAQAELTNQDLLVNAIGWLRGGSALVGIAPKTHVALTLDADPNLRARLVLLPTLLAFSLIVGVGVFVYLARRQ